MYVNYLVHTRIEQWRRYVIIQFKEVLYECTVKSPLLKSILSGFPSPLMRLYCRGTVNWQVAV